MILDAAIDIAFSARNWNALMQHTQEYLKEFPDKDLTSKRKLFIKLAPIIAPLEAYDDTTLEKELRKQGYLHLTGL